MWMSKWTRNTLIKQAYRIKKRDKFLFDVDDLVNVVVSAWTLNDSEFFHECMRVQMTFFILVYCFTDARIEAFLHNDKKEVEQKANENEKMIFQNLTWKVSQSFNHAFEFDITLECHILFFTHFRWHNRNCLKNCATLNKEQQRLWKCCVLTNHFLIEFDFSWNYSAARFRPTRTKKSDSMLPLFFLLLPSETMFSMKSPHRLNCDGNAFSRTIHFLSFEWSDRNLIYQC